MNIDSVKEPQRIHKDTKASLEDKAYYRDERIKDALHFSMRWFIYAAFVAFLLVFGIRIWHLVMPNCWHWLTSEQVQGVDKVFFSGAIGGVLGGYLKDKLVKNG